jgi:hypothetical protein
MSADGNLISFASRASDLVAGDSNARADAFVYDHRADVMTRVSVSSTGDQVDRGTRAGMLSADGRFVTFVSYASRLVEDDTNQAPDIFVRGPLDDESP